MIVSAIAAMAANRVIGREGGLPWNLPEDMKFFREKTSGHIILMGRKTFESFPKLLPKRLHVIVTRQKNYSAPGAFVFHTVEAALDFCRAKTGEWNEEVFVIGGGEIYTAALPYTDRIYLTEIRREFPGDAKFPEFSKTEFVESSRVPGKEETPYDFVVYDRKHSAR